MTSNSRSGELPLDGEDDPGGRLARRVGDNVELDGAVRHCALRGHDWGA